MAICLEPAREVPVHESCDVLVAGGGPAGIAAAVAAARTGADVRLIEVHGCLGGIWTAGLLSWIIDSANKPGLMREITEQLRRRGAWAPRAGQGTANYGYDPEAMKLLLEDLCHAAGVKVRLHTSVVGADVQGGRLRHVLTESKSGRQAWAAKVFIDCTGDGDLAARAGCGFDVGHPETGACQPMSLICLLVGLRFEAIEPFVGGNLGEPKKRLLKAFQDAGVDPSYHGPTIFRIRDDLFCLMANHEYGVLATDADHLTAATLRARAEVHRLVDALRATGGPWAEVRIVATAEQIGVREGRRPHGLYTVTYDDMVAGARHPDAVCRCTFGADVHSTNPAATKGIETAGREKKTQPYDIPLRALIARDVEGLLLAGRCISGDFIAHSSYRVTGNSVALGQGAGTCAGLAARAGCRPQEVPFGQVAEALDALDRFPTIGSG